MLEVLCLLQKAFPPETFSFGCKREPKQKGSIQKIQVAALEDFFVFRRLIGPSAAAAAAPRRGADLRLMLALSAARQPQADSSNMTFTATPPPREKANQENPQIFLICKYKNNSSAIIATATTAACGRNREELLGPWPAGCKARSRAVADAGCHNSSKANAAAIPNHCCSVYTSHPPCARMKPTNQRR